MTIHGFGTSRLAAATLALFVAGCASSNQERRRDDDREEDSTTKDLAPEARTMPRMHGPKKRIGIVDFEDASHNGYRWSQNGVAAAARDVTTELLVKSGAFVVVEREQIAQVLKEQGLGMTGAISPQTAAKAGKLLGLQAIVTGKITDYDVDTKSGGFGGYYQSRTNTMHARVSIRMTDTTTGEIWIAESAEGQSQQKSTMVMGGGANTQENTLGKRALYSAISQMMGKILRKVDRHPWTGSVAKVARDGKIYITGGSDIGLDVGANLSVRRLGESITDPDTGAVIGHELGKVVGTLQVADHLNEKLTVCVSSRGAGYQTGDIVTLVPKKAAESEDD